MQNEGYEGKILKGSRCHIWLSPLLYNIFICKNKYIWDYLPVRP